VVRRIATVLLVSAALSLSGCTGGSSPTAAPPASTVPSTSPTTMDSASPPVRSLPEPSRTPAPTSRPDPTQQLVDYGRQGGLMGLTDRMSVRQDGSFTLTRVRPRAVGRTGHLTAAELANLRQVLAAANFATMPKVQKGDGADLFSYSVSHGGYQVLAQDGAIVPALRPVISTLSGLVAKYSG
jgi:PBP1b-binding outer membrane lipoprotein LpoB